MTLSPGEQWNLSAYYTHEKNGSAQVNNGTSNFPAIDNFTTALNDSVDTAGVTAVFKLVPKRPRSISADAIRTWSARPPSPRSPTAPTSSRARASAASRTFRTRTTPRLSGFDASVDCALSPKVTLTLGTWYEDYKFSDVDSVGLQNIYPGAFFLALNDGSYTATVGYVRLTYRW